VRFPTSEKILQLAETLHSFNTLHTFLIIHPIPIMSADENTAADNMPDQSAESQPSKPFQPVSKPIVVGIYGISGSGKTTLLNQLKARLGEDSFAFYDGFDMISSVVEGGVDAFKNRGEK
jgi:pantothenate kinase-related protein Tda10